MRVKHTTSKSKSVNASTPSVVASGMQGTAHLEEIIFRVEADNRIKFQRCGGGRRILRKKIGGD